MFRHVKKYRISLTIVLCITITLFYFCLPSPLFKTPYSTVLKDRDQRLLGAIIAEDGQWRFPRKDTIPKKFEIAITNFEDKFFYYHPGFDPLALCRALFQNLKAGRVVSGGSTITMQTIRLSRKGQPRTLFEKIIELILSLRIEVAYTKKEILSFYAAHAPFGGNVVGLETASWRYFGRKASMLSWGEATLLAVLPNQPSLLFPGKNEERLIKKRNRLLNKLFKRGYLDSLTCSLAKSEPLPTAPLPQPMLAPHLLNRMIQKGKKGQHITTTLSSRLQNNVNEIIDANHQYLKANEVYNLATIIVKVSDGEVMAYVGNTNVKDNGDHGDAVDIINAARSSGSILKPFLYASMLHEGQILPKMLLPDIPTYISGFAPQNYNRKFEGAIQADMALAKSLNIPAVRMLSNYGVEKFYNKLTALGMSTLNNPSGHYGLSLILGGAEAKLWDLATMYAGMARTLNDFSKLTPHHYRKNIYTPPKLEKSKTIENPKGTVQSATLSAASIWYTFEAMLKVYRPGTEANWELYETSKKIAWKTGTSYGHRDAWAVGVTPEYVVGVWAGNADGEGRPGLTGLKAAAPVLFDIFDILPSSGWFEKPFDELSKQAICSKSGCKASQNCNSIDTVLIPTVGIRSKICPYAQQIYVDKETNQRINNGCETIEEAHKRNFFVLPPVQEWYYRFSHADYETLPPYRQDCRQNNASTQKTMEMIYPVRSTKVFIPRELDGTLGKAIFEVAHRNPTSKIYWHLNEEYLGETSRLHEMPVQPQPGKHTLTLIDESGEILVQQFEVVK